MSLESYQSLLSSLREETEKLENQISARSAEFRKQTQPITLADVQAAIPAGAVLVEFAHYSTIEAKTMEPKQPRYAVYVLGTKGDPRWVELGEAEAIDRAVDALRQALADSKRADVKQLARALDEKVMRPVRALLGDTRQLLISPDGALNLIPFAALVDETNEYLIKRYSLGYLTSGRDLLRLQSTGISKDAPLVLANPLFDTARRDDAATTNNSRAAEGIDFTSLTYAPLPGTASEAAALGAILPSARVLTEAQATEAAVKQANSPRILHIATHGFFLPDQPRDKDEGSGLLSRKLLQQEGPPPSHSENPLLRSGLILAGVKQRQSGAGEDGVLTALEMAGMDLRGTKLVALSACETGLGDVKNGDGVYGLRRALVLAGAESQVMSLWQVSDMATRDLMVAYYKRLQAGEGRTAALCAKCNWRCCGTTRAVIPTTGLASFNRARGRIWKVSK
jgi:CHAT domain-containing protein